MVRIDCVRHFLLRSVGQRASLLRIEACLLVLALLLLSPTALMADQADHGIGVNGVGGDLTLSRLQNLRELEGIEAGQFTQQMWVDPYHGDDANPGTYEAPLRSIRKLKQECLNHPNMRCTVKGMNRAFSPRTLHVSFDSPGAFMPGEPVSTIAPTADGFVVAADGDYVVLTITTPPTNVWGGSPTAPEPRVNTVITGLSSGVVVTVTDFEDTIVGLHSVLFAASDIAVSSPAVMMVDGHGYSNGDGPLMWVNETTMPTTTGTVVYEAFTRLYACSVTEHTIELSGSAGCIGARVNVTAAGEGTSQLISYHAQFALGGEISAGAAIQMTCDGSERDRICSLFESELPEWPWIIDGGGFYLNEVRSVVYSGLWPGLESGGTYNTPTGYLLGVSNSTPDLSQGWLGIQNGTVQNLALDALATTHGGKLVALNVKAKAIRNGESDRSQAGAPNPPYQAHNSCIQTTGTATDPSKTGAVAYWINGGGSWNYQGSHTGSGGCINPNRQGVIRVVTRGKLSSDVFSGDTNCNGTSCESTLVVNPTGDLTVVGPVEMSMGPMAARNRFHGSGIGTATRYYKATFDRLGSYSTFDTFIPPFFNLVPLAAPEVATLDLNEVTFRNAEKGALFNFCEAQDGSFRHITGRNLLVESSGTMTYQAMIADCKGTNCGGDCGTVEDAIENTYLSMEGVLQGEAENLNRYFVQPRTGPAGSCGVPGTFRDEICQVLAADARPPTQWVWFEGEESGEPGETYSVSMRSEVFGEFVPNDSCLPRDVLGAQLCALELTEGVVIPTFITLSGTPAGGHIDLVVSGVSFSIPVSAANSLEQIALDIAMEINDDPALMSMGVSAEAQGAQISTDGGITSLSTTDPDLTLQTSVGGPSPEPVPALGWVGTALLALILGVAGVRVRHRQR